MEWSEQAINQAMQELRSWERVPFCANQADRKRGIDCVRLVFQPFVAAGILTRPEFPAYNHRVEPEPGRMAAVLAKGLHGARLGMDAIPQFGDILVFRHAHLGFFDGKQVWHVTINRRVGRMAAIHARRMSQETFRIIAPGWKIEPPNWNLKELTE